jgi:hypothetical protein
MRNARVRTWRSNVNGHEGPIGKPAPERKRVVNADPTRTTKAGRQDTAARGLEPDLLTVVPVPTLLP